jgi:hypothetical protein
MIGESKRIKVGPMLGKFFDGAGILLAGVLTLCAFLLLFLPWKKALNIPDPPPAKSASSEVYVMVGMPAKAQQKPSLPAIQRPK